MANEKIEAASRRIFIKTAAVASASAAAVNSLGFAPSVLLRVMTPSALD